MLRLNLKTFSAYTILVIILTGALVYSLTPTKIEYKEKIVTEIQERVRTITKIKVSPDGTTETIIDEKKEFESWYTSETESKPAESRWLLSSTITYNVSKGEGPTYGIGLSRKVILGLYGGLYVDTDKNAGLALSYSF